MPSIEDGIRSAAVCLADFTTNNPNVWYELGFAVATGRQVVMVCSSERTEKYPFDIQHRKITPYKTEAKSDFIELGDAITERLKAALERGQTLEQIAEAEPIVSTDGLSQIEMTLLAVAAGASNGPGEAYSAWSMRNDGEKAGLSNVGISIAQRRLFAKKFLEDGWIDDQNGENYRGLTVTAQGWDWIDANEGLFTMRRPQKRTQAATIFR